MSSGLRLVTRLPSTTTSSSIHDGAGVAQVGLQRRPGRHPPALGVARLEQGPRPVADRRHRLAGVEERLHEGDGLGVHAQLVGVHHAAGKQQRAVVVGARLLERHVDLHLLAPLGVVPAAHAVFLRRDDARRRPRAVERLARFQQFRLLEAVVGENGDGEAIERLGGHLGSPVGVRARVPRPLHGSGNGRADACVTAFERKRRSP